MAGLAQLALFLYVAAPGLGGTSDSRLYLHAAQTLRETGQLLNPDGTPYRYWPPLYPALLAAVGSPVGIRMLHGACLLGSLGLWSWLGRQLLPARRALVLPVLLALSTPWLLVSSLYGPKACLCCCLRLTRHACSNGSDPAIGRGGWQQRRQGF